MAFYGRVLFLARLSARRKMINPIPQPLVNEPRTEAEQMRMIAAWLEAWRAENPGREHELEAPLWADTDLDFVL